MQDYYDDTIQDMQKEIDSLKAKSYLIESDESMPKITPIFHGHMDSKRNVVLDDKQAYLIWRCSFNDNDEIELILRKRRKNRTKAQNSYLWGVVYAIIAEHTGYDSIDEVHEAMKRMFLNVHRDGLPDTVRSSSDLSTAEFSEYVEGIKRWASSFLGLYIPDSTEVYQ